MSGVQFQAVFQPGLGDGAILLEQGQALLHSWSTYAAIALYPRIAPPT